MFKDCRNGSVSLAGEKPVVVRTFRKKKYITKKLVGMEVRDFITWGEDIVKEVYIRKENAIGMPPHQFSTLNAPRMRAPFPLEQVKL